MGRFSAKSFCRTAPKISVNYFDSITTETFCYSVIKNISYDMDHLKLLIITFINDLSFNLQKFHQRFKQCKKPLSKRKTCIAITEKEDLYLIGLPALCRMMQVQSSNMMDPNNPAAAFWGARHASWPTHSATPTHGAAHNDPKMAEKLMTELQVRLGCSCRSVYRS